MIFDIVHQTVYEYAAPSSLCQNVIRMVPRSTGSQHVLSARLSLDPQPRSHDVSQDYFGNRTDHFSIESAHEELEIVSQAVVETHETPANIAELTAPWDDPADASIDVVQYRCDSPLVSREAQYADYARPSFAPGRPLLEAAIALTTQVYTDFTYAPGETEVDSSVEEVFASRRGVCQDFAHFQIACLRSLGIPARYVSGYLATTPPPGEKRLEGADATHAWLSVYCRELGWIDLDPTNDTTAGIQHITVGWGRDYQDVAPVTGVFFGSGESKIKVSVDVVPREPS